MSFLSVQNYKKFPRYAKRVSCIGLRISKTAVPL